MSTGERGQGLKGLRVEEAKSGPDEPIKVYEVGKPVTSVTSFSLKHLTGYTTRYGPLQGVTLSFMGNLRRSAETPLRGNIGGRGSN
jgi:hypothetical protein